MKIKDNLFTTVKFVAEVISVKKDKDDKIIEGNPDKIKFVTDSWKFTKNINNKSPNWYLSEIISDKKRIFLKRIKKPGKTTLKIPLEFTIKMLKIREI